ncbi:hypothetical protein [Spirosoma agri]|uniref:Uncharacterized protein n=1 Tax=Spirosoma agri TaxID=1987381 RepID=A0A6M0ITD4_9BACT|nr:hypothetical protein [Spirosoma agri]NEU70493.1 hypothetical protein [Spirosoma agri]
MLLLIVTLDDQGHDRPFSCKVPQLEAAFEVLSAIAAAGDVVVSVDLLDNGQHIPLPAEAFDGEPIRPHIEKLEEDWKALLNKPVSSHAIHQQILTNFSWRLRETYQTRISWLEQAIAQTESRIQRMPRTAHWDSCYVRLEMQLTLYRCQLEQAQAGLHNFCQRWSSYIVYS